MLDETYKLLKEFYAAKNGKEPVNFVFLGHSQGGLRALAMSTYLKEKDSELYKQLSGVVTFSGIDKGLKLLENKGANFRASLYTDVNILSSGLYGVFKVFDFVPGEIFYDFIFGRAVGKTMTDFFWDLGDFILCDCLEYSKGFAYPIMHNSAWNQYAQIRDMCPQSDIIKKYVLEEKPYYFPVVSGTKTVIVWKKGWLGIYYPTLETEKKYAIVKTTDVNMKVDKDLPLKFIIGTHNDTLSMASQNLQDGFDIGFKIAGGVFTTAEIAHIVKCVTPIGFFTNSPVYAYDCAKAADWCFGYKREINELLGESSNDGLVAVSSQQLPTLSKEKSSEQVQILNKAERVFYYRNHQDIVDVGSASRNKINDYAKKLLEEKNNQEQ